MSCVDKVRVCVPGVVPCCWLVGSTTGVPGAALPTIEGAEPLSTADRGERVDNCGRIACDAVDTAGAVSRFVKHAVGPVIPGVEAGMAAG